MSGTAFLSIRKIKGSGTLRQAARHNRRAIQAEVGATGKIRPALSHLNEILAGPTTADEVAQQAEALMRAVGVDKLRRDAVRALEFVFSLPPDHQLDERAYFADCARWVAGRYGGEILSVDVHRDEAALHCHVLLLPLVNGRMVGSSLMGYKQKLLADQADFHAAVASRYGLKKAPTRLSGAAKAATAGAVLDNLKRTSDPALRSSVWQVVQISIEGDPGPYALALGIEITPPKKHQRTMTDIFISKGKGPAKEPKPISFAGSTKTRTLSCVGFTAPLAVASLAAPDVPMVETMRVRDADLDPSLYGTETGEPQVPPARRLQRQTANGAKESAP